MLINKKMNQKKIEMFDIRSCNFLSLPTELNDIIFSYLLLPRTIAEYNKFWNKAFMYVDIHRFNIQPLKNLEFSVLLLKVRNEFITQCKNQIDELFEGFSDYLRNGKYGTPDSEYHRKCDSIRDNLIFIRSKYKHVLTSYKMKYINFLIQHCNIEMDEAMDNIRRDLHSYN